MSALPDKPEVRDSAGRFAPGHRGGPGRKPKRDLRSLAEEHAFAKGADIDEELGALAFSLIEQARAGDVQAAATALRFLVVAPATQLEVAQVDAQDNLSDAERGRQLASILAAACGRDPRLAVEFSRAALSASGDDPRIRQVVQALDELFPEQERLQP